MIPLLKTNQLGLKTKQCTTLNEIQLDIEVLKFMGIDILKKTGV